MPIHGDADDSVPIELSRRYAERAEKRAIPCKLVELPDCGHFEQLDPSGHAWGVVTDWLEHR